MYSKGVCDFMKILISFAGDISTSGGMQRACITLANGLSARGHTIHICYGDISDSASFFKLNKDVKVNSFLSLSGIMSGKIGNQLSRSDKSIREILRLISRKKARAWNERCKAKIIEPGIKKVIECFKPDAILSFGPDMSGYLFGAGVCTPIVTLFRIEPRYILDVAPQAEIEAIKNSAMLQIQMPFFREQIEARCGAVPMMVIPNPVKQVLEINRGITHKNSFKIINVARFDKKQKRQNLLLEAFALVSKDFPDWTLEFWGDVKEHSSYVDDVQNEINGLNIAEKVKICGETQNIQEVYESSDIFAFPSAFEGFPNALAEAMASGLPVVAWKDCPSSAVLIQDGINGFLVEDVNEAAKRLALLMHDQTLRLHMGHSARDAMKFYSPEKTWDLWEELIHKSVKRSMG